ncbi:MAG: hypothetical protein ACR2NN_27235 [Bryobacteraceae bacterium]
MKRNEARFLLAMLLGTTFAAAQTVPISAATVQLSGYDTRGAAVPANSPATLLPFTVEGDTTGDNTFDIATSDPGVVVSLILPSGVEVTSANAVSLGFTFTLQTDQDMAIEDNSAIFSLPGTHTIIQVPAGSPSGTYVVRANATPVNAASAVVATYFASSTVRAGALTDASSYKVGDQVILSDSCSTATGLCPELLSQPPSGLRCPCRVKPVSAIINLLASRSWMQRTRITNTLCN